MLCLFCCLLITIFGYFHQVKAQDILKGVNLSYSNNTILITNIAVGEKLYWGEFTLRIGDGVCFCLSDYGEMEDRFDKVNTVKVLEALGASEVDVRDFASYGVTPGECDEYYKLLSSSTNTTESVVLYCIKGNLVERTAYAVKDKTSGVVVKLIKYSGYEVPLFMQDNLPITFRYSASYNGTTTSSWRTIVYTRTSTDCWRLQIFDLSGYKYIKDICGID